MFLLLRSTQDHHENKLESFQLCSNIISCLLNGATCICLRSRGRADEHSESENSAHLE